MKYNRIIEFKSTEENYRKESCDVKRNTVRIVSIGEDEDIKAYIEDIKYVGIINKNNVTKTMIRRLTDITRFESHGLIIYIFSW